MNSVFLWLSKSDFFKGLIVAFFMAVGTLLVPVFESGMFPDMATLKKALMLGIGAGVSYLFKNIFSNSDGKFLQKEVQ